MPLLIAALLCTAFCAGADSQSALDAWPTLKFGYSVPGKVLLPTLSCFLGGLIFALGTQICW